MEEVEKHENVWAAILDTPVEAANMRAKSELIRKIGHKLKRLVIAGLNSQG